MAKEAEILQMYRDKWVRWLGKIYVSLFAQEGIVRRLKNCAVSQGEWLSFSQNIWAEARTPRVFAVEMSGAKLKSVACGPLRAGGPEGLPEPKEKGPLKRSTGILLPTEAS
ncbi:uncharacterized protein N7500_004623 [Penicillium coprophilum]|uniref:uncharacterized protein n=1 Tax=Penicillium coprophilum TaxID=36646 RepID=UPI002388119F|nr:uncharacterized protein N7500_004623 [Penicillium coprophilum]KAJ5162793.1 hypothetical protein N7500_004623 [Penicillium coprophilum]